MNDWGNGSTVYLDRHNLQCNQDEYLNSFHLKRDPNGDKLQLEGTCCKMWQSTP